MSQVRRAFVALISVIAVVLGFTPAALALSVPRTQSRATAPSAVRAASTAAPSPAGYWLVAATGSVSGSYTHLRAHET
jgi:hypothetical protein